ncbi:unnamed protein product, partial [Iphiclides podalirius]
MALIQQGWAELDMPQPRNFNLSEEETRMVTGLNNFGLKLLKNMMKKYPNQNIVISPASISCLLAMTLLGSVGRSYDELAEALGFSEDILLNRKNHEMFGRLLSGVNANDSWSRTMFADGVFVDERSQLRHAYRSYLQRVYNGAVVNVDFADAVKVKQIINEWVNQKTEGRIDEFLKETLPSNTKTVLLSALYFSGQWEKPFLPEHTRQMRFSRGENNVIADLMLNLGQFHYLLSAKNGFHMIAFPYNDSATTMYAIKPRLPEALSLSELMEHLDYAKIDGFIDQMTRQDVVVRFPKMELNSDNNLETHLKELGVTSIFNPTEANFALMLDTNTITNKTEDDLIKRINDGDVEERSPKSIVNSLINPGVYVDTVMHEVKIKIDEYGTEAVAATSSILARSSEQFYADSPFFIFIRNEKTKLITFSAVIFDPTV